MVHKKYKKSSKKQPKSITKRIKKRLSRYTAYVPKTIKASKNVKNYTIKKGKFLLKSIRNTFKNISSNIDNKASRVISSISK